MKKRIAVAMVLVILLSVCVGTLAGCDEIIKLNEERDANQVVASVSYAGQTAYVYKYELSISFNSYAYVYHNYYGLSYEAAADYLLLKRHFVLSQTLGPESQRNGDVNGDGRLTPADYLGLKRMLLG